MSLLLYIVVVVLGGGWSTVVVGSNVLRIHDASGLIDFSNSVNGGTNYSGSTVLLDSDISFTEELSQQFQLIGIDAKKHFLGTFDGQGHTISNLKVNYSSQYVGLFGYSNGCTIKNVVIDDSCSFASNYTGSSNIGVGGILGYCFSGKSSCDIENSLNMANISFTGNTTGSAGHAFLGGIAGRISSSANYDFMLRNCANYGSVTHSGTSSYSKIGGVVGSSGGASNRMYIQNCLNYGSVTHSETASSSNLYVGGIIGDSQYIIIENCMSAGKISSNKQNNNIGAIVGYDTSSATNITHSFWSNDVGYSKAVGYGSSSIDNETSQVELNIALVNNLNQYASAKQGWSKWLLITNSASTAFRVNDYKGFTLTAKIVLLPDIVADDVERTFSGWFSDKEMAVPFASTEVGSDTTLYGSFCMPGYVVGLDVNGGNELIAGEEEIVVVKCNGTYGTLPVPTRAGHGFIGWSTAKESGRGEKIEGGMKVRVFKNHTLYALWAPNNYTLTFVLNNGSEPEVRTFPFNTSIVYPENIKKEGHTFIGWDNEPVKMPANDITIAALWAPNNYTITFDTNGGDPLSDIAVTFNTPYGELPVSKRQGYLFSGWFTEANASVTPSTIVSIPSNHTLHAQWEEVTANVEIVFGTKDLSENEIRGIISEYTGNKDFTIAKVIDEEGGLRVIVKFNDKEAAESFIETVRESSTTGRSNIKNVGFITEIDEVN